MMTVTMSSASKMPIRQHKQIQNKMINISSFAKNVELVFYLDIVQKWGSTIYAVSVRCEVDRMQALLAS